MNKVEIFNTYINRTYPSKAKVDIINFVHVNKSGYVLFPDLSVLSEATINVELNHIIKNALYIMPDGKPSELIARFKGFKDVRTVSGYHLLMSLLKETNLTHYFYGTDSERLKRMIQKLERIESVEQKVVGYKAAPFVDLSEIKNSKRIKDDFDEIDLCKPNLIWIGISSPKQDSIAYNFHHLVPNSIILCVGGVFDYVSGDVKKSPEWMKKIGLRWLYRLLNEPKRLGPKYFKVFINLLNYYRNK